MYSESDLDRAVSAGVIPAETAAALRQFVARAEGTSLVDEEQFRLLTGFNDIFVAIAGVLLLVAVSWLGADVSNALGGFGVAVAAWGLAEYFTRARRMALPSILFLLAFVGGIFVGSLYLLLGPDGLGQQPTPGLSLKAGFAGLIAAAAAWAHWRRFRVPITVAAGAAALVAMLAGGLAFVWPDAVWHMTPIVAVAGVGVFVAAMAWDMSDRERLTRRSDVAFWLHLLAAPLIVHPIFTALGVLENSVSVGNAVIVIALYIALGLIALVIDRRALMVSSLAYVLYALSSLFRELGAVGPSVALTALIIGSTLLLLSAFWHRARGALVRLLPRGLQARLPLAQSAEGGSALRPA